MSTDDDGVIKLATKEGSFETFVPFQIKVPELYKLQKELTISM